ncbi:protein tyrosine phosphatase domain-containing protein 1 [Megalops cyprinoides]|uniref:protein tyrosine phosphatase domain-containing protein 1 n=1 Tax=Megalops cyprinoides TaxID=118141 RepID=UPI001864A939|nr:protein tyrosine phosphatase domain-containing protein 1 [Megalops cyprinoides]
MTLQVPVPRPSYSQARENLVRAIPPQIICLLGCGGIDCRYEGPACWRPSQQAIRGLFSTWVTDDIVAMARPSTRLIKRYSIIEQFQQLNIKSLINMQLPGEHAHCGPPLEPESGFTYSPQTFMENEIFFYNFGMTDFGVSSLAGMLDGVKVLAFAVKEGKVAVHCHAGLGRTGVLIACYLVYTLRVSPSEAVHYVRIKRPRSIQTRAQINMVFDFARLLAPQLIQYPSVSRRHGAPFSLQQYLQRQDLLLHGEEARGLRNVPKIVYFLCGRLVTLALGQAPGPAVWAELQRRAAVLDLAATVRKTLVVKKFLPIHRDTGHSRNASVGSIATWDDPQGFLERKKEVLLNKRSYSDSDLSKIELFEVRCKINAKARGDSSPAFQGMSTRNCAEAKCRTKRTPGFPTFRSNAELRRNQSSSGPAVKSQAVAKAMAEQDPPGDDILQRVFLLQDELNGNECVWAILATELDPAVLSCLLWTWLEKLKEPVLKAEDVEALSSGVQEVKDLETLHKSQDHTISCILSCVSHVTSLCPQLESAVLYRVVRALTRCPQDDLKQYAVLVKLFKATVKGFRCHSTCTRAMGKTLKLKTVKKSK